jgi:type VII secretion protein EccB
MQTRRDQVQAHAFVAGRLVSAMLRAEPDTPNTPLRRFVVGAFCGVLAAVLLIAGFGIFGYLKPGGKKAFRQPGALIVEKETGSRYVLVGGELRPVLNFASAKLILGSDLRVVSTSRNSLKGLPHGLPVGIESAPDALPDSRNLDAANWQVCSVRRPDETGAEQPFVTLRVGRTHAGAEFDDQQAILVGTSDGTRYLAWNNRRLRIQDDATLGALGYADAPIHPVGSAWINALPVGPDLKPPEVADRGQAGPVISGRPTRIGQLFEVESAGARRQFFVMTRNGLGAVTPTGAALILGDARTKQAYPGRPVAALPLDPATLATAPRADQPLLDAGLPPAPPAISAAGSDEVPCLQIRVGGENGADVSVAALGPAGSADPASPTGPGGPDQADGRRGPAGLADQISVEPGAGLLIRALPSPGVADGTKYLLVDTGFRYPLPDEEAVGALGYGAVSAVAVPTTLLSLIPAGRPLDPAAATATQPVAPQARGSGN